MYAIPSTVVVGVSGLSSTGKTTLSRLLCRVFPNSTVLHQDDFYLPDSSIPVRVINGESLQDWDCVDAFDLNEMVNALKSIHEHGKLPRGMKSLTAESAVGEELITEEELKNVVDRVQGMEGIRDVRIVFVDGILLYQEGSVVEGQLDVKLFLRAPYDKARQRRKARTGYVTIEGFWTDPPGYFDRIVWPNYVKGHKHLFVDEDVEGSLKPRALAGLRIHAPSDPNLPMPKLVEWALETIVQELRLRSL